jgi:hypothetical protein
VYRRAVLRHRYVWTVLPAACAEAVRRGVPLPELPAALPNAHLLSFQQRDATRVRQRELVQRILAEPEEGGPAGAQGGVRCSKCGSTDIQFEIGQTRSADEGSTVFCLCSQCHKRWRM